MDLERAASFARERSTGLTAGARSYPLKCIRGGVAGIRDGEVLWLMKVPGDKAVLESLLSDNHFVTSCFLDSRDAWGLRVPGESGNTGLASRHSGRTGAALYKRGHGRRVTRALNNGH
jgi:hypothetical protein